MKVVRLTIANFRGIKSAELLFDGHTLMVGTNNVGKSTICEALDLVLGPDRLNRFPPVDEFDYYNATYLTHPVAEGEKPQPVPLRIEAVLIELCGEIEHKCGGNIEFWHLKEQRILGPGEVAAANPPDVMPCLRIETLAKYDPDEDEFIAKTYFSHSPDAVVGELTAVPKPIKRLFGFLYPRQLSVRFFPFRELPHLRWGRSLFIPTDSETDYALPGLIGAFVGPVAIPSA